MFGVYFGKYLQDKGLLSKEQYDVVIEATKSSRVKMGLLAVESGYMTEAQADEVNMLQQMQDKRFGDIAVEKGYLTDEKVVELLKKQGDQYLLFVQALIENNIMTLETIQSELNAYKKVQHYTASDIEALKTGDVDKIVPIFTKDETIPPMIKEYIGLAARSIVRFVDRYVRMEKVEKISDYTGAYIGAQEIVGDHKMLTSFGGDGQGLKVIAEAFAKETFEEVDLDVIDAVCEFLNCTNGLYVTKLSNEDVDEDMCPPIMKDSITTVRTKEMSLYKVPFFVEGVAVDLVVCIDADWEMV